ncbi:hypothetical protein [Pseudoalteromonas sp. CH_XMU1449-3]|uniref:hypothetical protein n=1 Tax=Pseudoalteromonas sp. CH_XMU1449-3 TaxID=3107774 RepID=UPI00300A77DF
MKLLRINETTDIPQFTTNGNDWRNIDEINKNDISDMLNLCIKEDVSLENIDCSQIKNPAQKIIFTNIYNKFKEFIDDKVNFKDQIEGLYKEAMEKYRVD